MTRIHFSTSLLTIFGLILVPIAAVNRSPESQQECGEIKREYERFRLNTLKAWKKISTGNQLCAPCTRLGNQLKKEKAARARQKKYLVTMMITVLASGKRQATVPYPEVKRNLNGAVNFSCESGGQPLTLCVWEKWGWNGQRDVIIVDQEAAKKGRVTSVPGIRATTDGLETGKCVLKIQRLKQNDFGRWSCTLVTQTGRAYGGIVAVEETDPTLYFATWAGIKRYSLGTAVVETVGTSSYIVYAVAYDWLRDRIYWSSAYEAFRTNRNGTEVETVLNTREYGDVFILALDWVSGNIYIASHGGFILACDGRLAASFACATVVTGERPIQGIALDPVAGKMYWTTWSFSSPNSIMRSELDGGNPVTLVTGLGDLRGFAIDFSSQRVYCADFGANKIKSCDLQGQDVQTAFQLSDGLDLFPKRVAVVGNRIYWVTRGSYKLQSGSKGGNQVITHYSGTVDLFHLSVVPSIDLPRNRINHCEGHNCPKVCVLTATSSRCLE